MTAARARSCPTCGAAPDADCGRPGSGPTVHSARVFPPDFDTESSVSRQHYIDTGDYLTVAEVKEIEAAQEAAVAALPGHCPGGPGHAGRPGEGFASTGCPECTVLRLNGQVRTHRDVYRDWAATEGRNVGPSIQRAVKDRMTRLDRERSWPS